MGMPTATFRDRLVAMAHNAHTPIWVIAVDPAYTSVLGRSHWLAILKESFSKNCTSHQAAAVVIGRRGLGFLARRSVKVHEAEQESRKRCFDRQGSIRNDAPDKTAHTPPPSSPLGRQRWQGTRPTPLKAHPGRQAGTNRSPRQTSQQHHPPIGTHKHR